MFILTTIQDLIQLKPEEFSKPSFQAIKDAINTKYSNRIIQNVGLCIAMYDLLEASEGLIGHGTGLVNINAEFRMIVFRPFRGEIIEATIKSSTEEGIILDMKFTSEIFVGPGGLPEGTFWNAAEGCFVWKQEDTEEGPGVELFFDNGEPVLFRVEQEEWTDQRPGQIQKDERGEVIEHRDTSWKLIGSMNQPGLGPCLWWGRHEDKGENGEGAEEEQGEDVEMEE